MNDSKIVAVLFGGQSAEHAVSVESARHVHQALLQAGFETLLIGIDQQGIWRLAPRVDAPETNWPMIVMLPGLAGKILVPNNPMGSLRVDAVFPVLHGPHGEDGSVQGLLRLCQVPFVGCDVLASALCMDKIATKQILNAAGLRTAPSLAVTKASPISFRAVTQQLGKVVFVKPANMGSSIGVARVNSPTDYTQALDNAFKFDNRVLIESEIAGREVECALLFDGEFKASVPGEIVPTHAPFYSYDAKYVEEDGAQLIYPANLTEAVTEKVREMSIAACNALGCEGLVRVDFFLCPNDELLVNELNTMPGFTDISMYPKLWNASGRSPAQIVSALVQHALDRFDHRPKQSLQQVTA